MPHRILVVEDDSPTREMYRFALEMKGLEVRSAADGRSAVKLIEGGYAPDVIILDWLMPGMSGSRFCSLMRQGPWKRFPLLVISGSARDVPADIASLEKPFDLTQLYSKINQTVGYPLIDEVL